MNLLELFEARLRRDQFAETSIETYRYEARRWLSWCAWRGLDPLLVTRRDVESHREEMIARGLKPATLAQFVIVTRIFYETLIDEELLQANPTARIRARRGRRDDNPKSLSLDELKHLLSSIEGDDLRARRDRAIIALMALHGLRRIETHRLDNADIHAKAPAHLTIEGKGSKVRRVYLRSDTFAFLRAYREERAARGLIRDDAAFDDALFVALRGPNRGSRLSKHSISLAVETRLEAAGLRARGISCHALRHTFGTLSVAGGASIEQVRDAMGHSSLATTSIYVRAVGRVENNPARFIIIK